MRNKRESKRIVSMHVFVTAGTGFVGRAVCEELIRKGNQVTALVRSPQKAQDLAKLGVSIVVGDMLKPETYLKEVKEADVTIHCAQLGTSGKYTRKSKERINEADKIMTEALAGQCLRHNKALIYTSGCFNYGDHGDQWITEASPANPSPLGEGHHAMVEYLLGMHREKGLKVTVLTAGFVYGPGGLFKSSFYDTMQKGQLRVFGKGNNYWSPVHVADLASAYALAAEGTCYGENFNVVDDQPITLRQMVDLLTQQQGVKKVGNIPPWLIGLLIGGELVKSLTCSFRVRNDKAKKLLNWQPTYSSFALGVPEVLEQLNNAKTHP